MCPNCGRRRYDNGDCVNRCVERGLAEPTQPKNKPMSIPNDNRAERRHIDNIPQGTPVICNGYNGAIVRQYDGDTYEVRLASGVVATDDFELAQPSPAAVEQATQPQPQQGDEVCHCGMTFKQHSITTANHDFMSQNESRTHTKLAFAKLARAELADIRQQRDVLQAQRDELLAFVRKVNAHLSKHSGTVDVKTACKWSDESDAAIARATEGGKASES